LDKTGKHIRVENICRNVEDLADLCPYSFENRDAIWIVLLASKMLASVNRAWNKLEFREGLPIHPRTYPFTVSIKYLNFPIPSFRKTTFKISKRQPVQSSEHKFGSRKLCNRSTLQDSSILTSFRHKITVLPKFLNNMVFPKSIQIETALLTIGVIERQAPPTKIAPSKLSSDQ
jgi:hypothetical protein